MIIDLFHNYYLDLSMEIYCTGIIVTFYGGKLHFFLVCKNNAIIYIVHILKVYGMCVGHTS